MKNKKSMTASIIAAVIIIVVAVVVVVVNKTGSMDGLAKEYACVIPSSSEETTTFKISFDASKQMYQENISVRKSDVALSAGTYTVDGDKVTLTSESGDVQNLIMYEKYLVATDYLYDGTIPDGDTFDASCSYMNSNDVEYTLTFKADGTYIEDDNGSVSEGTYERDGDMIKRTTSDGSTGMIDYLIYKNQITNSYYVAQ